MNDFNRGYFCAVATLIMLRNEPGLAADILKAAGFETEDVSTLDDCDKIGLSEIYDPEVKLTGLSV